MNNKIYVVTHKPFALSSKLINKGYQLITVGNRCISNEGVTDSDGADNIAWKNNNYCELTAVYWIWKNVKNDVKGFCHYRRFFTHNTLRYDENKIIGISEADKILTSNKNSIILPEQKYYNINSEKLYLRCGYKKDLDTTRCVIKEKYPDYLREWDEMLRSNSGYITNMMITTSGIFDSYCEWLFDILSKVEKCTDLTGYSKEESRIYGYISERLLGVWVKHNKLNIIEYQSINPEKDSGFKFILYRMSMRLGLYRTIKNTMRKIGI